VTAAGGLDQSALQALLANVGDADFVRELADSFLAQAPGQVVELRRAAEQGQAAELRRLAHTLKSNAATFGATGLAESCRALEHAADGAGDGWNELLARVEAELESVTPALRELRGDRAP
jgi:HPt (histidine-containing phosphotransfer) domain-containing protein